MPSFPARVYGIFESRRKGKIEMKNIMVMILVMDTKILILIMKVNFDILESEKHHTLKKVQFIQLLLTKIIMKMTVNMSV